MKTALITGADGFVGRHMSAHLEGTGWNVARVDVKRGMNLLEWVHDDNKFTYDLIVHAAAAGPNRKAIDTQFINFPYNAMLDAAMFTWAIRTRQPRFVYLSSSAVYSNELTRYHPRIRFTESMVTAHDAFDTYGETKRFGERMAEQARETGMEVVVVRPFSGYGSDQSEDFPFGAFISRAHRREDPFTIWGNQDQVRDWIHINDICQGIMRLVEAQVEKPVNLCTGRGVSMRDLAMLCHEAVGYAPHIDVDSNAPMGVMHRVGDPTFLHKFYEPRVTIEEGVKWALTR